MSSFLLGDDLEWKRPWTREARAHSFRYVLRPTPFGRLLAGWKFHALPALRRWVRPDAAMYAALPALAPAAFAPTLSPRRRLFPLDLLSDGRAPLYYLARNAIYHGLRALGLGAGDRVLMPAYHHGVEVEAVEATGAEVAFYRVDRRLLARPRRRRAARAPPVPAPSTSPTSPASPSHSTARWRSPARLGLLLVEDCALALFSRQPTAARSGPAGTSPPSASTSRCRCRTADWR